MRFTSMLLILKAYIYQICIIVAAFPSLNVDCLYFISLPEPQIHNIAKLSPAPASAGLRFALFPFDPPTHPATRHPPHRDSSLNSAKTAATATANCVNTIDYISTFPHLPPPTPRESNVEDISSLWNHP